MKPMFLLLFGIMTAHYAIAQTDEPDSLVRFVHPIIGTQKMGHTYPGATVPFGSIQLSPDTDTLSYEENGKYNRDVYRYCAGYQYDDSTIVGFSHTHFNGTGHSDLGDFLIMPTQGRLQMEPGSSGHPEDGFRSAFRHATERAEAGYYRVLLDDDSILAELTATSRIGIHQYSFSHTDTAHIILDLMSGIYNYPDKNVWTSLRVENDSTVTGYRQTNGWARNRTVYFAITFSRPFHRYGAVDHSKKEVYHGFWGKFDRLNNFPELSGTQLRTHFDFPVNAGEKLLVKLAISPVSTDGALRNLKAEAPGWDFAAFRTAATARWEQELRKVKISSKDTNQLVNFYTAMYHAFINPTEYMDIDGQYKGLDQNIHRADSFVNYTTFSLWDTHRALHPLFNIIQAKRNRDMIRSMLAHQEQSVHKMLPVWSHYANENWCMTGYHSVSVIADAVIKGNADFDVGRALDACIATASVRSYDGIGEYIDKGFIADEHNRSSVSTTLEYAYDDWCIAQLAKKIGRTAEYEAFIKRSRNFENVFDSSIRYMRP